MFLFNLLINGQKKVNQENREMPGSKITVFQIQVIPKEM